MATNSPSVVVTGYVQVAPNDRDTFIKILQPISRASAGRMAASRIPLRSMSWTRAWYE